MKSFRFQHDEQFEISRLRKITRVADGGGLPDMGSRKFAPSPNARLQRCPQYGERNALSFACSEVP